MTPRKSQPKVPPVQCPRCKQPGNKPPGLTLGEYGNLEAVFVGDELIPGIAPQRLTCNACGHQWPVQRGTIEVRKP